MEKTAQVTILFFAKSRELAGFSECKTDLPTEIRYTELIAFLNKTFKLDELKNSFLIALNSNYLEEADHVIQLNSNDEIAVIPPISGG